MLDMIFYLISVGWDPFSAMGYVMELYVNDLVAVLGNNPIQ